MSHRSDASRHIQRRKKNKIENYQPYLIVFESHVENFNKHASQPHTRLVLLGWRQRRRIIKQVLHTPFPIFIGGSSRARFPLILRAFSRLAPASHQPEELSHLGNWNYDRPRWFGPSHNDRSSGGHLRPFWLLGTPIGILKRCGELLPGIWNGFDVAVRNLSKRVSPRDRSSFRRSIRMKAFPENLNTQVLRSWLTYWK